MRLASCASDAAKAETLIWLRLEQDISMKGIRSSSWQLSSAARFAYGAL